MRYKTYSWEIVFMRITPSLVLTALAFVALLGCSKSAPYPMAPLPIGPGGGYSTGKPEAVFTATPTSIQPGETVQLQWSSSRADEAVIEPGAGTVPLKGSLEVRPTTDTTYTLWLRGPGGENTVTAKVAVRSSLNLGPTVDENEGRSGRRLFSGTFEEEVSSRLQDIYFDYDSNAVRPDQQATLDEDARTLRALFEEFQQGRIIIEGHCDERGSSEYNLALGDHRAQSIVDYLGQQGVPLGRIMLVGYGEEMPQCTQANEACYQLNRRAHFNPRP
jgi:peptidoglycan-associated lipoprotein